MRSASLRVAFLVASLAMLMAPVLLPVYRLTYFAPIVVIACYQRSLLHCSWIAMACGYLQGLMHPDVSPVLHSIIYAASTALLYRYKHYLYEDSVTVLPVMTLGFALISTLITWAFYGVALGGLSVTWRWVVTDLILMPCLDGLYAFLLFTLPMQILRGPGKRRAEESARPT